jgi:hypothetical protein
VGQFDRSDGLSDDAVMVTIVVCRTFRFIIIDAVFDHSESVQLLLIL